MSNQNLVPRNDGSGSLGTEIKRWGNGFFASASIEHLQGTAVDIAFDGDFQGTFTGSVSGSFIGDSDATGSLTGSFKGDSEGIFNGQGTGSFTGSFDGVGNGSFFGEHSGSFTGDGAGLFNVESIQHISNAHIVNELADFPAPTGSTITLEDDTLYLMNTVVNIGTNRIVYGNNSNIRGLSFLDGILYEGTGSALTSVGNEIRLFQMQIQAPSGSAFDFTGDSEQLCVYHLVGAINVNEVGRFEGFNTITAQYCRFGGLDTGSRAINGIVLNGTTTRQLVMNTVLFANFADDAEIIKLNDGFQTVGGSINGCVFDNGTTAVAIKVGENVTITEQFTVVGNNFFHTNLLSEVGVITGSAGSGSVGYEHPDWIFRANSGIRDSVALADYYMPDSATPVQTVIPSQNTMVKLQATTSLAPQGQRFTHENNRATYIGKRPITVTVNAGVSISGPANNTTYELHIHKNGAHVPGGRMAVRCAVAGEPYHVSVVGNVFLQNGDYIELWVQNNSSAQNVTCRRLSTVIQG